MRSALRIQLDQLDPLQRRLVRLDRLAALHEFAHAYVPDTAASNPVESALEFFRYANELRVKFDTEAVVADLLAHERHAKTIRRLLGPSRFDSIRDAIRDDTRPVNSWSLHAFRDVLAVSQAIHIVEAVQQNRRPEQWQLEHPELAGQIPDLERCGISPLDAVMTDAPFTDEPAWAPLWAMAPASRQLTEHLTEIGTLYKRDGAYEALHSTNADRVSQVANSGIELMIRTAEELISTHPTGAAWLKSLTEEHGRQPPRELFRGSVALQRNQAAGDFDEACRVDVLAADCVAAALRTRSSLERLKHNDKLRRTNVVNPDEIERLRRCLVAVEAVMILLTGIVQLRVDDQATKDEFAALDFEELEAFSERTRNLVSTRYVLTHAAALGERPH